MISKSTNLAESIYIIGKPLSRKTAVHHLSFISDVFSYVVRMDMVSDNPCRKVYVPKGKKKEKEIYSIEEIEQLFKLLENAPLKYRTFITLAVYTGFRRGELMGLEWKDIDFENEIISIRRTSNYTAEFGVYTDTTKTKKSQRTLKIAHQITEILKELMAEQKREKARLGSKWNKTDRLFTTWDGHEMNPQTPYHFLKKFCEKHDLPFYGIHSFRHYAASSMIAAGIDVTTVSATLGHCNSTQTLNTYSHMFQDAQARVTAAMDKAFGFI